MAGATEKTELVFTSFRPKIKKSSLWRTVPLQKRFFRLQNLPQEDKAMAKLV